jgi:hypothetical protein
MTSAERQQGYRKVKELYERMYDKIYDEKDPTEFIYICTTSGKSTQWIQDEIEKARKWITEYKEKEMK